jgi:hypothetical protein
MQYFCIFFISCLIKVRYVLETNLFKLIFIKEIHEYVLYCDLYINCEDNRLISNKKTKI